MSQDVWIDPPAIELLLTCIDWFSGRLRSRVLEPIRKAGLPFRPIAVVELQDQASVAISYFDAHKNAKISLPREWKRMAKRAVVDFRRDRASQIVIALASFAGRIRVGRFHPLRIGIAGTALTSNPTREDACRRFRGGGRPHGAPSCGSGGAAGKGASA